MLTRTCGTDQCNKMHQINCYCRYYTNLIKVQFFHILYMCMIVYYPKADKDTTSDCLMNIIVSPLFIYLRIVTSTAPSIDESFLTLLFTFCFIVIRSYTEKESC